MTRGSAQKRGDGGEEGLAETWKLFLVKKRAGGRRKGKEVPAAWPWRLEMGLAP